MSFINNKIKIINSNGFKIIATNNINKGDTILIEQPIFNNVDIISLLYTIIKNKDTIYIKNLYPRTKDIKLLNIDNNPYIINLSKIINKYENKKIKEFLLSINIDIIYLYYYKILFNAFEMNNNSVILPIGAMMNHSCKPNIIFNSINIKGINYMEFKSINNINKGDELCYSYLRNYKGTDNKLNQKLYLLNHYNFICLCSLCNQLNNISL
jgi:hypothetical protein